MFCSNCGKQIADDAKFCGGCGVPTTGQASPSAASSHGSQQQPRKQSIDPADMTLYEVLGVAQASSVDEIQSAVKKQRTTWSNRVSRGGAMGERAKKMVKRIGEAEATLLDAAKRAEYDKTLTGEPEYVPQAVRPGEVNWVQKVYDFFDQQDWEMAKEAADKATSQQPDNPDAWFVSAVVYEVIGDQNGAYRAAKQLLLLQPDNPFAYEVRADTCFNAGDKEQALKFLQKMKQYAHNRGDADTEHQADEKIAVCEAEIYMQEKAAAVGARYRKCFDANGQIIVNSKTKEEFESLKQVNQRIYDKVAGIYEKVSTGNNTKFFLNCKENDIKECRENIELMEAHIKDAGSIYKKPLILIGIVLIISLIGAAWGGPFVAVVLFILSLAAVNFIINGHFNGIGDAIPGSLGSSIGTARQFGLIMAAAFLEVIFLAIGSSIHG